MDFYLDFLCPICKQFEGDASSTLDDLVARKKITLVYHPIAILDDRTNPAGYSTRAGAASGFMDMRPEIGDLDSFSLGRPIRWP